MGFNTWEAIARRQLWYRRLLERRASVWNEERISVCADFATLKMVVGLADRLERHEARMQRHMDHAMRRLATRSTSH